MKSRASAFPHGWHETFSTIGNAPEALSGRSLIRSASSAFHRKCHRVASCWVKSRTAGSSAQDASLAARRCSSFFARL